MEIAIGLVTRFSYLTEVDFGTEVDRGISVNFPDIPQLRGQQVVGISAVLASQLSYSPNGNAVTVNANAPNLIATFSVGSNEVLFEMPVFDLIPSQNSGLIRQFHRLPINWVKSKVTIVANAGVTAGDAVCFNIRYLDNKHYFKTMYTKKPGTK